jgi:hypothetical protein
MVYFICFSIDWELGVKEFVKWAKKEKEVLFVTNSSAPSPKELQQRVFTNSLQFRNSVDEAIWSRNKRGYDIYFCSSNCKVSSL